MTREEIINAICEEAKGQLKPDLIKYGKNYRAISESAILEVLNSLFAKYHIFYELLTTKAELRVEKLNSGLDQNGMLIQTLTFVATVEVRLVFHTNDGDMFSFEAVGMGVDSGDKAMGKALTGATKYALLKGFRLQYSDDPDAEKSEDIITFEQAEAVLGEKIEPQKGKEKKSASKPKSKAESLPPATEGQLGYIKGLITKLGMSDEAFEAEFGFLPYDKNIPMGEARKIIDRLKDILDNNLPF